MTKISGSTTMSTSDNDKPIRSVQAGNFEPPVVKILYTYFFILLQITHYKSFP